MDKRIFRRLDLVADQIIQGYRNGLTLIELGSLHEASPGTIRNLLMSHGEPRRDRGRRKKNAKSKEGNKGLPRVENT